jgi:hypothetical protein
MQAGGIIRPVTKEGKFRRVRIRLTGRNASPKAHAPCGRTKALLAGHDMEEAIERT